MTVKSLQLKILTLNCWGIPMVSKDRKPRMSAIAENIEVNNYDVICLQEVWTNSDYFLINQKVKNKLPYSHYFYSGVVGSGICVFSKYPILEVFYHQWPVNGYIHKIQHGDWFGGKGVGMCKLLVNNCNIMIYSAHLHAEYNRNCDEYKAHRVLQAYDTAQFIRLTGSSADLIVLAGDLNTEPGDLAYRILTVATELTDSFMLVENKECFLGTNENYQNSYTTDLLVDSKYAGKRIDYIMYRSSPRILTTLVQYDHPLPPRVPNKAYSYSDHEAVAVTINIKPIDRPRHLCTDNNIYKNILVECMNIFDDALNNLTHQKRFYFIITVTLFFLLLFTVGIGAPFGCAKIYFIFRLLIIALMFFTLIMSTIWNSIEYHAVIAGKLAMEINLKHLCNDNKKVV